MPWIGQLWASSARCALIAAFALKDYMANPIMVIFVYPVLFLFSVLIQYLFILGELYPPKKIDQWLMWTIMASICGNIIGISPCRLGRQVPRGRARQALYKPIATQQAAAKAARCSFLALDTAANRLRCPRRGLRCGSSRGCEKDRMP